MSCAKSQTGITRREFGALAAGSLVATYDPPVSDPKEFTLVDHTPPSDSPPPIASPYKLRAEPARKWKNLQSIPMAWLHRGSGGRQIVQLEPKRC